MLLGDGVSGAERGRRGAGAGKCQPFSKTPSILLRQSPGEGNESPLQCSGLENSMDCTVHGVVKSRTRLSDFHFHIIALFLPHLFICTSPEGHFHILAIVNNAAVSMGVRIFSN